MKWILIVAGLLFVKAQAQSVAPVQYPHPVQHLHLNIEQQPATMAYMDVHPSRPNGQTVLLFHGKNFNGFYWKEVIAFLNEAGYRVIAPDQVGWGRSSKPNIHYSFFLLADNTRQLLDSLGVSQVHVIGHSMGGMLATRFALMYPDKVVKLVLENPIGLEDYSSFVPYRPTTTLYKKELAATYQSYKDYQKTYYPQWKPEYEALVRAQAQALDEPDFRQTAWANALTTQMIYEQPVVYQFHSLDVPTLLIIGQLDRTVVGKDALTDAQKKQYGNYPILGKKVHQQIRGSKLVELEGVGHIPHIQVLPKFKQHVLKFLQP